LFNIGALDDISEHDYESMQSMSWPITEGSPKGTKRLFEDGKFTTANAKAKFISVAPRAPEASVTSEYPLVLNTGRVRDHWHTMARTGTASRLSSHTYEPYADVNPLDAVKYGLTDSGLAKVNGPLGTSVYVRVKFSEKQKQGSIFVPIHWNGHFSSQAIVSTLIPSVVDPISGQPESKHSIVNVKIKVGLC